MKGLKTTLKPFVKCSVSLTSKISQLWKATIQVYVWEMEWSFNTYGFE